MSRKLLRMTEVAAYLDVSVARAYALCREGLLPCVYLGRQIRVDEGMLDEWKANGGKRLAGGWKREA